MSLKIVIISLVVFGLFCPNDVSGKAPRLRAFRAAPQELAEPRSNDAAPAVAQNHPVAEEQEPAKAESDIDPGTEVNTGPEVETEPKGKTKPKVSQTADDAPASAEPKGQVEGHAQDLSDRHLVPVVDTEADKGQPTTDKVEEAGETIGVGLHDADKQVKAKQDAEADKACKMAKENCVTIHLKKPSNWNDLDQQCVKLMKNYAMCKAAVDKLDVKRLDECTAHVEENPKKIAKKSVKVPGGADAHLEFFEHFCVKQGTRNSVDDTNCFGIKSELCWEKRDNTQCYKPCDELLGILESDNSDGKGMKENPKNDGPGYPVHLHHNPEKPEHQEVHQDKPPKVGIQFAQAVSDITMKVDVNVNTGAAVTAAPAAVKTTNAGHRPSMTTAGPMISTIILIFVTFFYYN